MGLLPIPAPKLSRAQRGVPPRPPPTPLMYLGREFTVRLWRKVLLCGLRMTMGNAIDHFVEVVRSRPSRPTGKEHGLC